MIGVCLHVPFSAPCGGERAGERALLDDLGVRAFRGWRVVDRRHTFERKPVLVYGS